MITPQSTNDPYREWLRQRLSSELGVREADLAIQGAVQRRGWTAMRTLGPRDVVAVLQDVYGLMRETVGDSRADKWLEVTTIDLASYAEKVPVPAHPTQGPIAPAPTPVRWGRRAHDLPLLLARSHAEIAGRSLGAIRSNPDLTSLERAAEWDLQAAQAEVRRWETEEMLSKLRAEHARIEVADQVATAVAQAELLRLTIGELEASARLGHHVVGQLAHSRLTLAQIEAFLEAFTPLIELHLADTPLTMLQMDLSNVRFSLGVPLHPNVLRARHALNYTQWQAGRLGDHAPEVIQARQGLHHSEIEAKAQLDNTLLSARTHQNMLKQLAQKVEFLEGQALQINQNGGDSLSLARVRFEWRQTRTASRIEAHRMEESIRFLEAMVSET